MAEKIVSHLMDQITTERFLDRLRVWFPCKCIVDIFSFEDIKIVRKGFACQQYTRDDGMVVNAHGFAFEPLHRDLVTTIRENW